MDMDARSYVLTLKKSFMPELTILAHGRDISAHASLGGGGVDEQRARVRGVLFLRRRAVPGNRGSGRDGLLSLHFLPTLVRGTVNAFTLWKPEALKVTKGAEKIGTYSKTPQSFRKWCKNCGGHLFTDHPALGVVDVYAAMLPTMPFVPALHVHYAEAVLRMRDSLPKQKDMPKEMGGSGALLPD
jgi:hypothetical protein